MPADARPTLEELHALAVADGHGPHCPILYAPHWGSGMLGIGATADEDQRAIAARVAERQQGKGT